jgi:hypothetical protein
MDYVREGSKIRVDGKLASIGATWDRNGYAAHVAISPIAALYNWLLVHPLYHPWLSTARHVDESVLASGESYFQIV